MAKYTAAAISTNETTAFMKSPIRNWLPLIVKVSAEKSGRADDGADQRRQKVLDERRDDRPERPADDDRHRQVDHVAPQKELSEAAQHRVLHHLLAAEATRSESMGLARLRPQVRRPRADIRSDPCMPNTSPRSSASKRSASTRVITLANGDSAPGHFFVARASAHTAGPERVGELLNAEPGFFPFETLDGSGGPRTVLYNRQHVIMVALAENEARRDPGYDVATERFVSVLLSNGQPRDRRRCASIAPRAATA